MNTEEKTNPAAPEVEQAPEPEAIAPGPASKRNNEHLKVADPKCIQFSGRATKGEAERLNEAIEVRKQEGKPYDIVRLALELIDHIEDDVFQSFKTKKKR